MASKGPRIAVAVIKTIIVALTTEAVGRWRRESFDLPPLKLGSSRFDPSNFRKPNADGGNHGHPSMFFDTNEAACSPA